LRQFNLVDRIVEMDGETARSRRALTLAEDYLADHFPGNPVMPGVLMLESLIQTASWLVRVRTDFTKSVVFPREVRNVRYSSFVTPGETLEVEVKLTGSEADTFSFKGEGRVAGRPTVSARLALAAYNLRDTRPEMAPTDEYIIKCLEERWRTIGGPEALEKSRTPSTP
jgi:3-hydroxyacyl-[acyl-carrier-protein] dehydratase